MPNTIVNVPFFLPHIIGSLQEIAPIAHWTALPERNARGEALSFPPFIAWRYEKPTEELERFLRTAIATFEGAVEWELSTLGRRWILMPARIGEFAKSHGCDGGLIACAKLKIAEPDFGKLANAELCLLAEHLRCQASGRETG